MWSQLCVYGNDMKQIDLKLEGMQDLIEAGLAIFSRDLTQQLRFKTGVDPDITVKTFKVRYHLSANQYLVYWFGKVQ